MGWFIGGLVVAGIIFWNVDAKRKFWAQTVRSQDTVREVQRTEEQKVEFDRNRAHAQERHRYYDRLIMVPLVVVIAGAIGWWVSAEAASAAYNKKVAAYAEGWAQGWTDGCSDLFFKFSATGDMYRGNDRYTNDWCVSLNAGKYDADYQDTLAVEALMSSPESTREEGMEDGFTAALKHSLGSQPLCYGVDCITYQDYVDDWARQSEAQSLYGSP